MTTLQEEYRAFYYYKDGHLYHRYREHRNRDLSAWEVGGALELHQDKFTRANKRVGFKSKGGQWLFRWFGDTRPIDRAIYIYFHGQIVDGFENGLSLKHRIEHIDGNKLNNRIENLRRV